MHTEVLMSRKVLAAEIHCSTDPILHVTLLGIAARCRPQLEVGAARGAASRYLEDRPPSQQDVDKTDAILARY